MRRHRHFSTEPLRVVAEKFGALNSLNYDTLFWRIWYSTKWLKITETGETYFVDSWGNNLGYSTFKAVHPESPDGNNPTFDLWSTAGNKKQVDQTKWAKNW